MIPDSDSLVNTFFAAILTSSYSFVMSVECWEADDNDDVEDDVNDGRWYNNSKRHSIAWWISLKDIVFYDE